MIPIYSPLMKLKLGYSLNTQHWAGINCSSGGDRFVSLSLVLVISQRITLNL